MKFTEFKGVDVGMGIPYIDAIAPALASTFCETVKSSSVTVGLCGDWRFGHQMLEEAGPTPP
jgi:hypothetical protein